MNFWTSGTGALPQGTPKLAFVRDFTTIPNNTMAIANIHSFVNVEKDNQYKGELERYLLIDWKITDGNYKGQMVAQKIKCFTGKPEQIDRALNMLKLIMTLCDFKPSHGNAPTDEDLAKMKGKTMGIKIREWSFPKSDGSGMTEVNFVSEVHSAIGFKCEEGEKIVAKTYYPESALTRNADFVRNAIGNDELPF